VPRNLEVAKPQRSDTPPPSIEWVAEPEPEPDPPAAPKACAAFRQSDADTWPELPTGWLKGQGDCKGEPRTYYYCCGRNLSSWMKPDGAGKGEGDLVCGTCGVLKSDHAVCEEWSPQADGLCNCGFPKDVHAKPAPLPLYEPHVAVEPTAPQSLAPLPSALPPRRLAPLASRRQNSFACAAAGAALDACAVLDATHSFPTAPTASVRRVDVAPLSGDDAHPAPRPRDVPTAEPVAAMAEQRLTLMQTILPAMRPPAAQVASVGLTRGIDGVAGWTRGGVNGTAAVGGACVGACICANGGSCANLVTRPGLAAAFGAPQEQESAPPAHFEKTSQHVQYALSALKSAPPTVEPFRYVALALEHAALGVTTLPTAPAAATRGEWGMNEAARLEAALQQGLFEAMQSRSTNPTLFLASFILNSAPGAERA